MHRESFKISVIIPVYNTERYLRRCLYSVIGQTYTNIEVFLIDDGSTDNSGIICDEISAKDLWIKVIHKENGGQASARNLGLSSMTGEFVAFVDSDDWLDLETYEYAMNIIYDYRADAVLYDCLKTSDENDILSHEKENLSVYHGKDCLQYFMAA